ncbi:hypothetical protein ACWIT3_00920 [Pasteurella sp. P03HT]
MRDSKVYNFIYDTSLRDQDQALDYAKGKGWDEVTMRKWLSVAMK